MDTTLTQRYIAATIKSLPASSQEDVRAELTASIADAIEARVEQGEDSHQAERAVLTQLGDPSALAAEYADRPLYLIGPRYYLTWWRLLKVLLLIVPLCATGGVALAQVLAEANIGEVVGEALGAGVASIAHVFFWVTLVFVVLERTGTDTGEKWELDHLPEPSSSGAGRGDLIASLVFLGLGVAAALWDHWYGFILMDGTRISVLHPGLWPWAIAGLFVIMAAEAVLAVVLFARGRWSVPFAIANTATSVLFMSWGLTLLGRGELVNPQFIDAVFLQHNVDADTVRTLAVLLGFGLVAVSVWDAIDGWLKARRAAVAK